ncbi:AAA family ATPase [Paenibacillus sp. HJGM_3]|uniref:AAA family ATPase n=1 Tax=Paenibacillus sp. HJGM_3 TaxID=3379816 RepID=UPI0038596EDD
MIIMINGAFGVGKTTAAEKLVRAIPDSMLFDPEEVGYMLRAILAGTVTGPENTGDFQDFELWKVLTVQVAEQLISRYGKHLIVPMTLYKRSNYDYIRDGFNRLDVRTYYFCLLASEAAIYERLRARGEKEGQWVFRQTKRCVEALRDPVFAEYIDTESLVPEAIVDYIQAAVR